MNIGDRARYIGTYLLRMAFNGRPMKRIAYCFRDVISHQEIYLWKDLYGTYWLAEHAWSLFRVRSIHGAGIWRGNFV